MASRPRRRLGHDHRAARRARAPGRSVLTVYTLAVWRAAPGHEDEFVQLWAELADWTLTRYPHARGTLLRDREDPARFVSFGPWRDAVEAAEWRGAPEFVELVERMRDVLVDFQPGLFDTVTERSR